MASSVSAQPISSLGQGAGQTMDPRGLAVDFETGELYVADTANNRVDVFDSTGIFKEAFGWGVKDGASEFQVCTTATTCREGIAGSGVGQFNSPSEVAVDNDSGSASQHAVYVFSKGNSRIEKFVFDGGWKVELSFGSDGEGPGEFSDVAGIGIGPAGTVYVVDNLAEGAKSKYRLQKFTPAGALIPPPHILLEGEQFPAESMAVDISSGGFYVSILRITQSGVLQNEIRKYDPEGTETDKLEDVFEDPTKAIRGLAVGAEGNLFALSIGVRASVSVMELDPTLNRLLHFGFGSIAESPNAIAPVADGSGVYLSERGNSFEGNRVIEVPFPPPGPLPFPAPCAAAPLPAKATLSAEVVPEGKATSFHFEFISAADYAANGNSFEGGKPASSTTPTAIVGEDFKLHKVSALATGLIPETEYRCRVVAENGDGKAFGEPGSFKTPGAPEIKAVFSSQVETTSANLNAEVNPLGIGETTGFFEYVDDATFKSEGGFAKASKAPLGEPLAFGGGEAPVLKSTAIAGLTPVTTYHYRLVATDELIAPAVRLSNERTFRTYPSGQGGLPDDRGYELVSPGQKSSAEVGVPGTAGGLINKEVVVRINAGAGSGDAITYTSWTSFGDPRGASSVSQYLSKRTSVGWGTENISPYGFIKHPLNQPYRGFTPELDFGAFVTSEPALTDEAQEGIDNLYLRDNGDGTLQALTTSEPHLSGSEGFCSGYAGAAADGTHAIYAAKGAMTGTVALAGEGFSLYEWSAAKGLVLASVLPDGSPAPPIKASEVPYEGTGFGAAGGNCTMTQAPVRNAISADGSVLFWSFGGEYEGDKQPLFARIDGTETIQVDAIPAEKAGGGPGGEGKFWAANEDGSIVIFTAAGLLTNKAKGPNQLYRFNTETRTLIDLTPKADPQIEGVIGASEDGEYVYLVAKALLGEAGEKGPSGQEPQAGGHNLYLIHAGKARFLARLSELDNRDWNLAPEQLSARVSPDGHHLAFLSVEAEAISGFESTIAAGEHCQLGEEGLIGDPRCAQAYLYDATADSLTCASCNPAGSRPLGPAQLPGWSNPYEGPRYLSEDGSRLYFESRDALSAVDHNNRRDVYELERTGAGSCTATDPGFSSANGGCLSLISSGKSEDESYLLDASASGRDILFSTREALNGWDTNENYDVYDAREGGGYPEPPPPPPICEGEGCKPAIPPPPPAPAPATPTFQGPGDPKPKKHKQQKKKHKKHKGKGKGKKHKRAGQKGRAGR